MVREYLTVIILILVIEVCAIALIASINLVSI